MIEADSVHSTPRTDSSSIQSPDSPPELFATLADAEAFLIAQGFRPVGTADWINDAGDDAGIHPVEGRYGTVKAWRVEIKKRVAAAAEFTCTVFPQPAIRQPNPHQRLS